MRACVALCGVQPGGVSARPGEFLLDRPDRVRSGHPNRLRATSIPHPRECEEPYSPRLRHLDTSSRSVKGECWPFGWGAALLASVRFFPPCPWCLNQRTSSSRVSGEDCADLAAPPARVEGEPRPVVVGRGAVCADPGRENPAPEDPA